jgi:hypothetical protein
MPIELGFSAYKAWLKRHRHEYQGLVARKDHVGVEGLLSRGLEVLSAENAPGWFRKCGYT